MADDGQHKKKRRAAFVVLLLTLGAGWYWFADSEEPILGSTEPIEASRFVPWFVGDTHVHLAGDSGILFNNRCRPVADRELPGVMADEVQCAQRLASSTLDIATHNGLDWVILSEHAPWLGSPPVSQCSESLRLTDVMFPTLSDAYRNPDSCVRHVVSTYRHSVATQAWATIHDELRAQQTASGPATILGQEMGTAAGISLLCGGDTLLDQLRAVYAPGHFGVYSVGEDAEPLENTVFDCREDAYLADIRTAALSGSINHPDNGDRGSDWHCWKAGHRHSNGAPCWLGAEDFMSSVLPQPIDDPLPQPAAVHAIAIVTDDRLPIDTTVDNLISLLRSGSVVGFSGGSDSHAIARNMDLSQGGPNDGKMGLAARTYAFIPQGLPDNLDPVDTNHPVLQALGSQATVASLGPFLSAQVGNSLAGGTAAIDPSLPVDVIVTWPLDNPWAHFSANSGDFEITEDQRVPRDADVSHKPMAVELLVVPIAPGCLTCEQFTATVEISDNGPVSSRSEVRVNEELSDDSEGRLVVTVDLPDGPTDRWALVVSGEYEPQSRNDEGRYNADAWVSPIWLDASPIAPFVATDDRLAAASSDAADSAAASPLWEMPRPMNPSNDPVTLFPQYQEITTTVVDSQGEPLLNAVIEPWVVVGDTLVPVPARSRALSPATRNSTMATDGEGALTAELAPLQFVFAASSSRCTGNTRSEVVDASAGPQAVSMALADCLDDSALPIVVEPSVLGAEAATFTVEIEVTCDVGGRLESTGRIDVPVGVRTEVLRAPRGTFCEFEQFNADGESVETQYDINGSPENTISDSAPVPLSPMRDLLVVGSRGARARTLSTIDPGAGSFVIEAVAADESRDGDAIEVLLWCEGESQATPVTVDIGTPHLVRDLQQGQTCVAAYPGDRLAPWSFPVHEVLVVDDPVPLFDHEVAANHEHLHDVRFTVATFHIAAEPTDWFNTRDERWDDGFDPIRPFGQVTDGAIAQEVLEENPTLTSGPTAQPIPTTSPFFDLPTPTAQERPTPPPVSTLRPIPTSTPVAVSTTVPQPTATPRPALTKTPVPIDRCPTGFTAIAPGSLICRGPSTALVETTVEYSCPAGFEREDTQCSQFVESPPLFAYSCPEGTLNQTGEGPELRCFVDDVEIPAVETLIGCGDLDFNGEVCVGSETIAATEQSLTSYVCRPGDFGAPTEANPFCTREVTVSG